MGVLKAVLYAYRAMQHNYGITHQTAMQQGIQEKEKFSQYKEQKVAEHY